MKTFQISTGDDPEKDDVKDRKSWSKEVSKTKPKENDLSFGDENNDVPACPSFKPKFDEGTFGAFKGAIEQDKLDVSDPDDVIAKIKNKYDIADKRVAEIKWFILLKK